MAPDFNFTNHGSVCLLTPLTPAGTSWASEHLPEDAPRFGGGIAIEPRYAGQIIEGILNDGMEVA